MPGLTFVLNPENAAIRGTVQVGPDPGAINTIQISGSGFASTSVIVLSLDNHIFRDVNQNQQSFRGDASNGGTVLTASFRARLSGGSSLIGGGTQITTTVTNHPSGIQLSGTQQLQAASPD